MISKLISDRNARIAAICVGVVGGMVALSFAAVPLYDAFCRVTGFGGTVQRAPAIAGEVLDRSMTIQFDASRARDMPWKFKPMQFSQTLRIGELGLAFYEAENPTDHEIVGMATYNVSPLKAGPYFNKIECFCFTEQVLGPGERVEMPVTYFVDPAIADDPTLDDVTTITLSYTFHIATDQTAAAAGQ
ncbi:MAG: cytochrome c oxidase assembly protein [Parvularculaceae bacterium]